MANPVYTTSTHITIKPLPLPYTLTPTPTFKTHGDASREAAKLSLICHLVADPSTRGPGREAASDCFKKVADIYRNDTKLTGIVSQASSALQDSVNLRSIEVFEKFKANQKLFKK